MIMTNTAKSIYDMFMLLNRIHCTHFVQVEKLLDMKTVAPSNNRDRLCATLKPKKN